MKFDKSEIFNQLFFNSEGAKIVGRECAPSKLNFFKFFSSHQDLSLSEIKKP